MSNHLQPKFMFVSRQCGQCTDKSNEIIDYDDDTLLWNQPIHRPESGYLDANPSCQKQIIINDKLVGNPCLKTSILKNLCHTSYIRSADSCPEICWLGYLEAWVQMRVIQRSEGSYLKSGGSEPPVLHALSPRPETSTIQTIQQTPH